MYGPSLVVLCEYFDKKRGVATGIATSGAAFGAFVVPNVMVFLFERYGFSGGLFILGAVAFNCCVSGALYRPVQSSRPHRVASSKIVRRSLKSGVGQSTDNTRTDGLMVGGPLSPEKTGKHQPLVRLRNVVADISRTIDVSVWKYWRFSMFAASQMLAVMSLVTVWMLTPAIAADNGLSAEQSAYLLSAVASGDIVGRLSSGFLFDLPSVRQERYRPYSAVMLVAAVIILVWPLITSFPTMMLVSITFGFFLGILVAQRTNLLFDLVGAERFSGALGMMIFAQGVGVLTGPSLTGQYL